VVFCVVRMFPVVMLHDCSVSEVDELTLFVCLTDIHPIKNLTWHTFNGPLSRTTRVGRYQKGKTNLDFTEARDSEWQ